MIKNVSRVEQQGLCLECGTCEGMCPQNNIRLNQDQMGKFHISILDDNFCNRCSSICLKVCPGHEVDVDALNLSFFGSQPENPRLGNLSKVLLAYSNIEEVKQVAASGGVVSSLLIYALEQEIIQGVYLLQPQADHAFTPVPKLVTNRKGVLGAAGSIYWPAPICTCLRELRKNEGLFAFVGLPCEIQAVRKAQLFDRRLRDKIKFTIGIYCGGRPTIQGQRYAFKRYGIELEKVAAIRYRQPEWPGHLKVIMKDGTEKHVYKSEQLQGFTGQLFSHPRCLFCHDATAELADISTGDAWRLEDIRMPEEKSIVAVRSQVGLEIINGAAQAGVINVREIEKERLYHSQMRPIMYKHIGLSARLRLGKRLFRRVIPQITFSQGEVDSTIADYWAAFKILLLNNLTNKPLILKVMNWIPLSRLKKYSHFNRYG